MPGGRGLIMRTAISLEEPDRPRNGHSGAGAPPSPSPPPRFLAWIRDSSTLGGAVSEPSGCQILQEMDVREPTWVVVDPSIFDVAACPVHLGGLEAVARSDHLGTAALMRLGLCGVEEPPAEPSSSMVLANPQHIDVATPAPSPAGQPGYESTLLVSEFRLKEAPVVNPGRLGVELVDELIEFGRERVIRLRQKVRPIHQHTFPGQLDLGLQLSD